MQPHAASFEAIKSLEMREVGKDARAVHEATGCTRPEREYVLLSAAVKPRRRRGRGLAARRRDGHVLDADGADVPLLRRDAQDEARAPDPRVPGQLDALLGQIAWTVECTKALHAMADGQKTAMRAAKKKQVSVLSKLTDMVRGNLPSLERKKASTSSRSRCTRAT